MTMHRCPGQDVRFWKPKDIFEVQCPYCGAHIEFWKDDPARYCPGCAERVSNPRLDLSCAKWCKYAKECLGSVPDDLVVAVPVIERLIALLTKHLAAHPARLKSARQVCAQAENLMITAGGDPLLIKSAALLAGAYLTDQNAVAPISDGEIRPLLEQTGLATSPVDEICAIVAAVASGTPLNTPECSCVWHAAQLVYTQL